MHTDEVFKRIITAMHNTHSHLFHTHTLSLFTEKLKERFSSVATRSFFSSLASKYIIFNDKIITS